MQLVGQTTQRVLSEAREYWVPLQALQTKLLEQAKQLGSEHWKQLPENGRTVVELNVVMHCPHTFGAEQKLQ
jgi:hypothetical protein